jgi:hypothetical protein
VVNYMDQSESILAIIYCVCKLLHCAN